METAFQRDANHVPITNLGLIASKSITYAAGTTGAVGATTLFTVSGTVACNVFAICTDNLTSGGASTIEVGVSGNTASISSVQTSTDIDTNEVWTGSTLGVASLVVGSKNVVNQDIIQTIKIATITGGSLTYYCLWTPLSEGATVTAA